MTHYFSLFVYTTVSPLAATHYSTVPPSCYPFLFLPNLCLLLAHNPLLHPCLLRVFAHKEFNCSPPASSVGIYPTEPLDPVSIPQSVSSLAITHSSTYHRVPLPIIPPCSSHPFHTVSPLAATLLAVSSITPITVHPLSSRYPLLHRASSGRASSTVHPAHYTTPLPIIPLCATVHPLLPLAITPPCVISSRHPLPPPCILLAAPHLPPIVLLEATTITYRASTSCHPHYPSPLLPITPTVHCPMNRALLSLAFSSHHITPLCFRADSGHYPFSPLATTHWLPYGPLPHCASFYPPIIHCVVSSLHCIPYPHELPFVLLLHYTTLLSITHRTPPCILASAAHYSTVPPLAVSITPPCTHYSTVPPLAASSSSRYPLPHPTTHPLLPTPPCPPVNGHSTAATHYSTATPITHCVSSSLPHRHELTVSSTVPPPITPPRYPLPCTCILYYPTVSPLATTHYPFFLHRVPLAATHYPTVHPLAAPMPLFAIHYVSPQPLPITPPRYPLPHRASLCSPPCPSCYPLHHRVSSSHYPLLHRVSLAAKHITPPCLLYPHSPPHYPLIHRASSGCYPLPTLSPLAYPLPHRVSSLATTFTPPILAAPLPHRVSSSHPITPPCPHCSTVSPHYPLHHRVSSSHLLHQSFIAATHYSTLHPLAVTHYPTVSPLATTHYPTVHLLATTNYSTVSPLAATHYPTVHPLAAPHESTVPPLAAIHYTTVSPLATTHYSTVSPLAATHYSTVSPLAATHYPTVHPLAAPHESTVPPLAAIHYTTVSPLATTHYSTVLPIAATHYSTLHPLAVTHYPTVSPLATTHYPTVHLLATTNYSTVSPLAATHYPTVHPLAAPHESTPLPTVSPLAATHYSTVSPLAATHYTTVHPLAAPHESTVPPLAAIHYNSPSATHYPTVSPLAATHYPTVLLATTNYITPPLHPPVPPHYSTPPITHRASLLAIHLHHCYSTVHPSSYSPCYTLHRSPLLPITPPCVSSGRYPLIHYCASYSLLCYPITPISVSSSRYLTVSPLLPITPPFHRVSLAATHYTTVSCPLLSYSCPLPLLHRAVTHLLATHSLPRYPLPHRASSSRHHYSNVSPIAAPITLPSLSATHYPLVRPLTATHYPPCLLAPMPPLAATPYSTVFSSIPPCLL
ncbi:unnamed protein product [Acanthosepion pharaonis]|uniref:Uncharacterized protein n=1 Tax=Acanthosepion pharaonis TaxID=158019 RepID=A0A812E246_ACAPH|nr:unnamed protein product [Sepia pharaonis]